MKLSQRLRSNAALKKRILIVIIFSIAVILSTCTPPRFWGRYYVHKKEQDSNLKRYISDSLYFASENRIIPKTSRKIKNKKELIKLVEPLLFEKFGEQEIISEKPYQIFMARGFWVITGTMKCGYAGGTFVSVVDSESGEIVLLTHFK